eukprot:CAMPEP_0202721288 /NCGR_PEP_ID=MMETSP1385-20130828/147708_1 /ASSEMBLY_ACC=CAM_ASM_000861 /TAXON_ID=933848 /ORGANISM="Elphidium margaritaceum" /LENGTH=242 /DNA_ID=CAMNT_0049385461 /DNA_START=55 /DNA_END=783 /DNA_ORIENTATION=+
MDGSAVLQNENGEVVAIVSNINKKHEQIEPELQLQPLPIDADKLAEHQSPRNILSTTSDQTASILPPSVIAAQNEASMKNEITAQPLAIDTGEQGPINATTALQAQAQQITVASRWSKENRVVLKQLMSSLPPQDIGAALRVILDTFGVESSKLVRRGEYIELDLQEINDDYILDSLWNYCAQMQYNIMNTFQIQQQQAMQYQQQHMMYQQQPMQYVQPYPYPNTIYAPAPEYTQHPNNQNM